MFNKHEVIWSVEVKTQLSDCLRTVVAIFRRDIHDLENHLLDDIDRHGAPSGFDCQAGESKMKVQKLKNQFSNKHAPGKDVACKYFQTEVIRHIATGGSFSDDGSVRASGIVVEFVNSSPLL